MAEIGFFVVDVHQPMEFAMKAKNGLKSRALDKALWFLEAHVQENF